ncbi:hypothetical protein BKA70DRAFT_1221741 [Coprinopsis sp. MPI-PUGE-AT-0042]|nr:hypothetical protein BKA70DRAFT_1221741 [Coprinopsis sp. MPI-PUGE-AT-0042]
MQSLNPLNRGVLISKSSGEPQSVVEPCLDYLQNRIHGGHFQTLSTSPTILHWNSKLGELSPWKWPVELGTGRRVTPSDLESHRQTHHFQAPSCLCAYLDFKPYTESRIGIVHVPFKLANLSPLSGRCGYLVCLERFFSLPVLHMRCYPRRDVPLSIESLVYNSGVGVQASLLQFMPTSVVPLGGIKRE